MAHSLQFRQRSWRICRKSEPLPKRLQPSTHLAQPMQSCLVNSILIIRVLDVGALDGRRRAKLVLRRRRQLVGFRREKPGAKLAVAAHRVGVDAFDGRLLQHAMGGAIAAVQAFGRVNLPHPRRRRCFAWPASPPPRPARSWSAAARRCAETAAASPARSIEVWGPCVSGCRWLHPLRFITRTWLVTMSRM